MRRAARLEDVDLSLKLEDESKYEAHLKRLQFQLLNVQRHLYQKKRRAIIIFEGWDAAGKGGSIRRLVERLDPRGYAVHPIGAPRDEETRHHYLRRFWLRLPEPGSFAIFDRSWYGRVLVERVEHLCSEDAWKRAYREINAFERMLTDDGIPVVKLFLHISKAEQLKRFKERAKDPFKNWKITDDDWRNRKLWKPYHRAINDMFAQTSSAHAPWHAIPSEHKWYGRTRALSIVVQHFCRHFSLSRGFPKGCRLM